MSRSPGTNNDAPVSEWVGIGHRLREARKAANISVREMARRIEVSPSHVSQVERGLAAFSVRALYNVVNELHISMDSLFEHAQGPGGASALPPPREDAVAGPADPLAESLVVLRANARPAIQLAEGTHWQRLTARPETGAEFIEVAYPPNRGAAPPNDFVRHAAREYGIVTQGALTVQVAFDRTVLQPGDSIAFDSVIPHRFWNDTADEVRAIWFIRDHAPDDSGVGEGPATTDVRN